MLNRGEVYHMERLGIDPATKDSFIIHKTRAMGPSFPPLDYIAILNEFNNNRIWEIKKDEHFK